MTTRLIAEFANSHSGDAVRRAVAHARMHLLDTGVRRGLVPATESAARLALRRTTPNRALIFG